MAQYAKSHRTVDYPLETQGASVLDFSDLSGVISMNPALPRLNDPMSGKLTDEDIERISNSEVRIGHPRFGLFVQGDATEARPANGSKARCAHQAGERSRHSDQTT